MARYALKENDIKQQQKDTYYAFAKQPRKPKGTPVDERFKNFYSAFKDEAIVPTRDDTAEGGTPDHPEANRPQ